MSPTPLENIHRPLAAEDSILLLSCRQTLEGEAGELFARCLAGRPAWDRLYGKATYHRLTPLVHYHLQAADALDRLPPDLRQRLQAEAAELNGLQNQQLDTLHACFEALERAGIAVALLKGPMLQPLYPPGVARSSYDLDLLVAEGQMQAATAALLSLGFSLETRIPEDLGPKEAVAMAQYFEQLRFVRPGQTPLELHFRLYNYGIPSHRESLWERLHLWDIGGRQIPGPPPEDLLLFLVTHANLHAFGRILWYYDIAAFYRQWGAGLDWPAMLRQARQRRLATSFYFAFNWINQLVYPETSLPEIEPLKPAALKGRLYEKLWRKSGVFSLKSYIRPFDAAQYYLLGTGTSLTDKLRYLWRILFPDPRWLAAHLERPASSWLNLVYLRQRRRERRDWSRITRKDILLDGAQPSTP